MAKQPEITLTSDEKWIEKEFGLKIKDLGDNRPFEGDKGGFKEYLRTLKDLHQMYDETVAMMKEMSTLEIPPGGDLEILKEVALKSFTTFKKSMRGNWIKLAESLLKDAKNDTSEFIKEARKEKLMK